MRKEVERGIVNCTGICSVEPGSYCYNLNNQRLFFRPNTSTLNGVLFQPAINMSGRIEDCKYRQKVLTQRQAKETSGIE